ncbi:MAG: histidine kinase [Candidatus Cloacimonetes bacterium]|nr:histidine kinase [Candidatus Cloacimonadota bacterium]
MKLKHKFLLFVIIINLIFLGLSLQLLAISVWYFLLAECLIIISILISITIYRQFVQPLNLISAGVESIKDKDFTMQFVPVGQYELDNLITVYNSMIDKLREERVQQQEQHYFLQKLIDSSGSGIIILNLDETVFSLNPAAAILLKTQLSDIKDKPLSSLENSLAAAVINLKDKESIIISLPQHHSCRISKGAFIDRGFYRYFIQIEELTREILQAERKANEKVIRMISHEINNSIGAVNSILQSFHGTLENNDAKMADTLEIAIRRNKHLIKFMSNFARVFRLAEPNKELTDLNRLLQSIQPLIAGSTAKSINWHWHLSKPPVMAEIDVNQFEQVIVNILKNAVEAIESSGNISIYTQTLPYACLKIINDGIPLSPDVEKNIFSPFFSSKENGQGIGLTLSQEILKNHQFDFALSNNSRGEVEFVIRF